MRSMAGSLLLSVAVACCAGCGDGGGGAANAAAHKMLGVIEGFYGPPYSSEQRLDLIRFLPGAALDTYVYAPKNDAYLRARWRDPYPPESLDEFRALTRTARAVGVRFVLALSPGADFDPDGADGAALEQKLAELFLAGVRDFCLLFDDLARDSRAADPRVEVQIVGEALAFLRGLDPDSRLCFISHYYAGRAEEIAANASPFDGGFPVPSSAAYAAYADIPADVAFFWTGPRVFASPLTAADTAAFRALAGHPLLIWDNYPVNDVLLSRELFLAPYRDREAGVIGLVDGVLLNPMLQPEASKIALWTAGRFFAEGDGYDPDAALDEALEVVAGDRTGARVLARLAEQFHSHPLIGDEPESPILADRAAAFFAAPSGDSEQALRALLQSYADTVDDLARDVPNQRLVAELAEPANKLSLLGRAGLLALDLLDQRARGEPVDDSALRTALASADASPWLVGANTPIAPGLDLFLAGRPAVPADVFGAFFARVFAELGG
jgi:hypothetical protein